MYNNTTSNVWKNIIHKSHVDHTTVYKGMLKAYFSFINPDNVEYANQIIWNNRNIFVWHPNPILIMHACFKGINLVSELYNNDRSMKWVERGVSPEFVMLWRSIVHAIPIAWKHKLRQGFDMKNCVCIGF